MKKVLWLIVCLMTMVMSANAQTYTDDLYGKTITKKNNYWDEAIVFGGGLEYGKLTTQRYGEKINYYGFSVIAYNVFCDFTLSDYDSYDDLYYNMRVGSYINVLNFGDYYNDSHSNQLKLGLFLEFVNYTHVDGRHLHEHSPYHNCQVWVDTSEPHLCDDMNLGVCLLYRYKSVFIETKGTTKSLSVGLGLCI